MAANVATPTRPKVSTNVRAAKSRIGDAATAARISREIEGEVRFDAFSRGRYSTDASHYQIEPIGVVIPKTDADIARVIDIAADEGLPVLPRGAGTSKCGQTVGEAIVVDVSRHLNQMVEFDPDSRRIVVQPGMVLDHLNAFLTYFIHIQKQINIDENAYTTVTHEELPIRPTNMLSN